MKKKARVIVFAAGAAIVGTAIVAGGRYPRSLSIAGDPLSSGAANPDVPASVNVAAYDAKLLSIANLPPQRDCAPAAFSTPATDTAGTPPASFTPVTTTKTSLRKTPILPPCPVPLWPVWEAAIPDAGAILPFKRIVAYYGNFYSTQMGILGEYPPDEMLARLASTTAMWAAADPSTPVVPALDYIAVAAQASAGPDGKYRLRMPPSQIEKAISLADGINGLVFLDVQVGLSNVETEVPLLAPYLKLPNVELSLDPEFAMHNGERPGTVIGTLDASDINFAAQFLAKLVDENRLPPKILVVHRFTQAMVTNYRAIKPLPEVQIVMDMDGFGSPARKLNTYRYWIAGQPVQFTGFKLFYKNDSVIGGHLMTPEEVLRLSPQPSYIQYQ